MYRVIEFDKDRNTTQVIGIDDKHVMFIGGSDGDFIDYGKLFNCFKPDANGYGAQVQRQGKHGWVALETRYK